MFKLHLLEELVLELREGDLPEDWRARAVSEGARRIGDTWAEARASVALSVPSVIVPNERNYLLNPLHLRFSELVIDLLKAFRFNLASLRKPVDKLGLVNGESAKPSARFKDNARNHCVS